MIDSKKGGTLAAILALAAMGTGMMGGTAQVGEVQRVSAADREVSGSTYTKAPADRMRTQRANQAILRSAFGRGVWSGPPRWPSKEGWTDRGYRRAALKKRNRARHRAACKGGR